MKLHNEPISIFCVASIATFLSRLALMLLSQNVGRYH